MVDRSSEHDEPEIVVDEKERIKLEAENSLRQTYAGEELLQDFLLNDSKRLRASDILALHRVLMTGLSPYAGSYRPGGVKIRGSNHVPPPADQVASLIDDLCDYLKENWNTQHGVHLAAYSMWQLNWIHPFSDGNGRTARIVAHVILGAHSRKELPGDLTIPEQISRNKKPYYSALEDADRGFKSGLVDLSNLEGLISGYLANQLYDFYVKVSGDARRIGDVSLEEIHAVIDEASKSGALTREAMPPENNNAANLLDGIERRPVLYGCIVAIVLALIGWFVI